MGRRSLPLPRGKDGESAGLTRIPRWVAVAFVVIMSLLIGLGIYIGLHSRVFGPDY